MATSDLADALGRRPGQPQKRVLAISSSGGHFTQLMRLSVALSGHDVTWVTTNEGYRDKAPPGSFHAVRDASLWDKKGLVVMLAQITKLVLTLRPDVVLSTGAAPGYFAIRVGNAVGARSVWVDSIANAEQMSLSGQRVGRYADLWLTQWEHLAQPDGPHYCGSVL
ncbi:MAG: UDP-N-acetylglucosamine--LPS N-acetylglucosamine transferase [Deltaproteobacteria bacterium]|nr:UDP-N-acetylglucosamine--LPS N-acetylglucosamine transferase [Deltaproteobacteria bacterium]